MSTSRLLILSGSAILFLLGVLAVTAGGDAWPGGVGAMAVGGVGIAASLFERTRYRSGAAERAGESPGPGGGERREDLQGRFQRTDEVFRDPSTGYRMRVYIDSQTGERRYVAED